jgi:hypothetical protein
MRVLVGCEESGVVRNAFRELGHEAWSCDIIPASDGSKYHIQDDVLKHLKDGWDLAIFHPPCTFLSVSGNRWLYHPDDKGLPVEKRRPHPNHPNRLRDRRKAIAFFMKLAKAPIQKIALENPIGVMSTVWRKPDIVVQPWWFGHMEQKATCLWLKNLPVLQKTNDVYAEMMKLSQAERERMFYMAPSADRSRLRSVTYTGVAKGMADTWGKI